MTTSVERPRSDRRAAARRIFHGPIDIQVADAPRIAGRGIDISCSGMGLHCPRNLLPGTSCSLQFALVLNDGLVHATAISGVVVNSTLSGEYGAFRLGIQFYTLAPALREVLQKYIGAQVNLATPGA